jgi:ATP-dependent Clp protease ATP-binding subunit ClpX
MIPEFLGRFPIVTTLDDMDAASLIKVLREPKNSISKQYTQLFMIDGMEFDITDNAAHEIVNRAMASKTGARGLRKIMESVLLETMFEACDADADVKRISIEFKGDKIVVMKYNSLGLVVKQGVLSDDERDGDSVSHVAI